MAIESPLQYISKIQDLVDLHDFMDNEEFTEAMDLALKCIADPNIPVATARAALIKMQAFAFQFRMQAAVYTYLKKGSAGTEANTRKNVYFAVSEQCHELAQTLKYFVKENY